MTFKDIEKRFSIGFGITITLLLGVALLLFIWQFLMVVIYALTTHTFVITVWSLFILGILGIIFLIGTIWEFFNPEDVMKSGKDVLEK